MKKLTTLFLLIAMVSTAGCMRRGRGPEDFYFGNYSEAEALYNRKQYDKALQRYQAYVDENPEGNLATISQYYMAKCYVAMNKPEEAKTIFKKIIAEHPDLVWANFSEAQLKEMGETVTGNDVKK